MILREALQFEAVMPQLPTFDMVIHPPTHVQLNIPTVDILEYATFEYHVDFHIDWESFAHRDQQKHV